MKLQQLFWVLCATAPLQAFAQAYPSKPIRLVVPFPPGGGADVVARIVAGRLSERLGQTIIVDNRAGASGNIGAGQVAKSAPDGYTLLFTNNTIVANPAIGKVPFDVVKDFAPVAMANWTAVGVAVHPDVPAKSVKELLALLRDNPTKYSYASCGNGTTMHLAGEMFKQQAKVSMTHVSYKGCAPAVVDTIAGHVPIVFSTLPNLRGPLEQGKLRVLAITSPQRTALAPQLPALGEVAPELRGVIADTWSGIFAPAGTPASIIAKLNAEINAAISSPEARAQLAATGSEVPIKSPSELGELVRTELERWTTMIKETGLVVEQ